MIKLTWIAVFITVIALAILETPTSAAAKQYLTYDTFKALTNLCPEVKTPRLAKLEPAGQDLWAQGQMKIPAETHLFQGDFNHNGVSESAIVITDGIKNYVVIAEKNGAVWRRTGFVPISKQTIGEWNGHALSLDSKSFVAWNGTKFRLERGPLALYCYGYEKSEFMGVMIKMTYVGAQEKGYTGLLISSVYLLPDISAFKSHRTASLSYVNDDIPTMWHLALSQEEMQEFALALNNSRFLEIATDRKGTEGVVNHSLSIVDTRSGHRPNYFEVFLAGKETASLLETFAKKIEPRNSDAAKVLREYANMFAG